MRSKVAATAAVLFLATVPAFAQESTFDAATSLTVHVPDDAPVSLLGKDAEGSRSSVRGGAMTIDLHVSLSLRNSSYRRVRGVTLLVVAQEFAPFGKASVAKCVDVRPGDEFPVRIDVRLVRPLQASNGPLVQISLDGVLFEDLAFYGPNRLNSRRSMTAWEMEARRDREYFKRVLQTRGGDGLRQEILASLNRQAEIPRLSVTLGRGRSTTNSPDRIAQFAFLDFPDSPVKPTDGWAEIAGNELRAPRINVVNKSSRPVRYVEVGWLVKDQIGREFLAGSVPAADGDLYLPPGQTGRLLQDTSLRFTRGGQQNTPGAPVNIQSMTGFVSQVEFADGKVWVPGRNSLEHSQLLRVMAPSPEEQRLTDVYLKRGLNGLVEELSKFQ